MLTYCFVTHALCSCYVAIFFLLSSVSKIDIVFFVWILCPNNESRLKMKITKFERVKKEKTIFEQAVELARIQAEKILKEQK